ncbi:MAG: glycoside hydrolase family 127 protein [Capsulimonadaceae bacterium]|nr:glycoside hydrolase family 127 protein [Capsulimonadaceae bacterium]
MVRDRGVDGAAAIALKYGEEFWANSCVYASIIKMIVIVPGAYYNATRRTPLMKAVCQFLPSVCFCALLCLSAAHAQQNPSGLVVPGTQAVADRFVPLMPEDVHFNGGLLGDRYNANETNRLLNVDENDLLDAFERRDVDHQAWQGEHCGKFLHAAMLTWACTKDAALRAKADRVADRLLKTQEPDGYLGTYASKNRWTSWDVWTHKYDLLGLLAYYQYTHSQAVLSACVKIGDLLLKTFGPGPGQRDINLAGGHMGLAPDSVLEPIVLLYRATGYQRYKDFAHYIILHYDAPTGPKLLSALKQYHSVERVGNAKAYEMLSNFNGVLELYRATGDSDLLSNMKIGWDDIVENHLYPTGSASAGEHFIEDKQSVSAQLDNICETCVTVTWEQFNLQLARLTGDAKYADAIEQTVYNHLLAAQKPTGDDWAYYTPLDGHKQYDRFTTCCHSSGPRGIALLTSIAYMTSSDGGIVVNLYNPSTAQARIPSGVVSVRQETRYPIDGHVDLYVHPVRNGQQFPLRLRIPSWANGTAITVNGKSSHVAAAPGTYAVVNRAWRQGDRVGIAFKLSQRIVLGKSAVEGTAAVEYGPLVLALDEADNPGIPGVGSVKLSSDSANKLNPRLVSGHSLAGEPVFQATGLDVNDQPVTLNLVPFAFAGHNGTSHYEVWIPRCTTALSLLSGGVTSTSRVGNRSGSLANDDGSLTVTYDGRLAPLDWYAVTMAKPVTASRVVFAHGQTFHDGGWFDTSGSAGKPVVQVQQTAGGAWVTVATLSSYPDTTKTAAGGLKPGRKFEAAFAPVSVVAVRVLGAPASGDDASQSFSSCCGLAAFAR